MNTDGIEQLLADVNAAPDVFTGIYGDPATHTVHIRYKSTVTPSGELFATFTSGNRTTPSSAADSWTIAYDPASFSATDLEEVTQYLGDHFSPDSGIEQYGIDPTTATVSLGVSRSDSPLISAVQRAFPGETTTFPQGKAEAFTTTLSTGTPGRSGDPTSHQLSDAPASQCSPQSRQQPDRPSLTPSAATRWQTMLASALSPIECH